MQVEASTHHIYLADFGVSKVLHKTMATIKTNASAGSIGTLGYQPVEQLEAGVITESVDVYSLGCVLLELFGGLYTLISAKGRRFLAVISTGGRPRRGHDQ